MLGLAGISKRYGSQVVLADATWAVPDGARVGLTGPNGAGKSTLLRIIAREVEPDTGEVSLPRGAQVGYLPQNVLGLSGVTVRWRPSPICIRSPSGGRRSSTSSPPCRRRAPTTRP
jgi:ATP-binding cassette subfamily F protein 3